MYDRCTLWLLIVIVWFTHNLANSGKIYNGNEWIDADYPQFQTKPPTSTSYKDESTEIFVSLASFRDGRCAVTLKNIFTKAKNPKRIRVGVISQIHTEEDKIDCIEAYCALMSSSVKNCPFISQIFPIEFSYLDSRGPGYARHLESYVINDEEFCLQIDAHTDFIKDWDTEMTIMWGSINNEYAILSTVPPNIDEFYGNNEEVPHLCEAFFDKESMIKTLPSLKAKGFSSPILTNLWSSSFSFSKCHAEIKTPYDPNFQFFTSGDDFSKYARLWTRGYDVYTPNRNIVAHDDQNKMFSSIPKANNEVDALEWRDNGMTDLYRDDTKENAKDRMDILLGYKKEIDGKAISSLTHFGLGLKRSLDQFIQFTGIDTRLKVVFDDRCKQLNWIPFSFDRDPLFSEHDVWGDGPEMILTGDSNIPLTTGKVEVVETNEKLTDNASSMNQVIDVIPELRAKSFFVFGVIDYIVTKISLLVDETIGFGHSLFIIKLLLLAVPIILIIVVMAVYTIFDGSRDDKSVKRF